MKTTLEQSYPVALLPLGCLPPYSSQHELQAYFLPGDVVLMNSVRDEREWLSVAQACVQSGTDLLVSPFTDDAEQLAGYIRKERISVVITTAQRWANIYRRLNQDPGPIIRLKVILTDTSRAPELRYALLPRALSKAQTDNVYKAYQKAPWIQAQAQR